jgi:hypothetical protein
MYADNFIDFPVKLININSRRQRRLNYVQAVPVQEEIPIRYPLLAGMDRED